MPEEIIETTEIVVDNTYNDEMIAAVSDIRDFVSYGFLLNGVIVGLLFVILISKGWKK